VIFIVIKSRLLHHVVFACTIKTFIDYQNHDSVIIIRTMYICNIHIQEILLLRARNGTSYI